MNGPLAAAGLLILLGAGCAAPPAAPPAAVAPDPERLTWTPCGELPGQPRECADIAVPLDYANPDGAKITLALARIPARGPGTRLGSILVDPGGPGISGVDEILTLPNQLSSAVEARYDVVGWDRRGVARSSPVWCRTPEQMGDYARALAGAQWSDSPDTPEVTAWAEQARAFADGCAERSAEILTHLGTRDSARDMESIRNALGEQRLNYVGWSHGTKLGAIYIDAYPDKVGRMVLDSGIDPSLSIPDYNRAQSQALEAQLLRFVDYCTASGDCPLPAEHSAATAALKNYLISLPVTSADPSAPTRADVMAALSGAMYIPPESFPELLSALRAGFADDGGALIDMGGLRVDPAAEPSNQFNAMYAINCFDSRPTPGLRESAELARQWDADTPIFGAANAWVNLRCTDFAARDPIGPARVRGEGAPAVVIIGALKDGATPIEWSRALADQLVSSRLVVADTDVHAVYPAYNACVTRIVDAYLLDGDLPPRESDCPAD